MNSFILIAAIQLSKTNAVMPKLFLKHLILKHQVKSRSNDRNCCDKVDGYKTPVMKTLDFSGIKTSSYIGRLLSVES